MALPRTRAEASALLGVAHDADTDHINDRHRKLAQIFHPDLNPGVTGAGLHMQEINAARELLLGDDAGTPPPAPGRPRRGHDRALSPEAQAVDDRLRRALHEMPYGVYVVGTTRDGETNAMIADWFMQVSFTPRLAAVAFEQDATSLAYVRHSRVFTVNLLPVEGGMDLAAVLLQPKDPAKIRGRSPDMIAQSHDKLADIPHHTTPQGCPILDQALAWISCEAEEFFAIGDHVLVTGRITDGALIGEGDPLTSTYTGWTYGG